MSARTLILAVMLLAVLLWLMKFNMDNPAADVVTDSSGEGDPLGFGAAVQAVADKISSPAVTQDSQSMAANGATLKDFAQAIYDFEDPQKNGLATRNNNPGNLKYAHQSGSTGADENGFAIFPTFDAGFQALIRQLQLNVNRNPDFTLLQDRTHYLGGNVSDPQVTKEGNPFTYAAFIAGRLGASVDTTLGQLFGGNS